MEEELIIDEQEEKPAKIAPWIIGLISIFILALIIFSVFPIGKADPEPKNIPKLTEVTYDFKVPLYNHSTNGNLELFLDPQDEVVKTISDRVVYQSCSEYSKTCYAKSIYYFVRDNFQYVNDPPDDYVKSARDMLKQPTGDCEDSAILLANMLESVGIKTAFVYAPNHVYIKAYIEEAKNSYKDQDGWIALDSTCKQCRFAQNPN